MTGQTKEKPHHRVVISGISGRFPKSDNINEFQSNLLNKEDCTTDNHGRWNLDASVVPQRLGTMNNIEKFDRIFFGIHNKLSEWMDPAAKALMEHCFEAIMDAGINPRTLGGANIAVFTSTSFSESEKNLFVTKCQQTGFSIVGGSRAMISNRLSFYLGFNGPSYYLDNHEASGALMLQNAYNAIRNGDSDGALICGTTLCLQPILSYQLKCLGLLSPDGVTRCFDDNANGCTRSEGIAVLFLQRANDAKRIYQEVINANVIHVNSHESQENIWPSLDSQIKVMQNVLNESGLSPNDIAYVEASGTSIKEEDATELQAIEEVYCKNRKTSLPVGSVKSIVGNAFTVNSLTSIIKMIIGSESGKIAANLHYEKPNSKSSCLKTGKICIPTDLIPWTGQYYAVNTSAAVGVFGHAILKSFIKEKKNGGVPNDDLPRLVVGSGRTEEAVVTILISVESKPVDVEYLQLLYDVFQSEIEGHLYRGYTILPAKGLISPDSKKQEVVIHSGEKKEVWWVFSGMGSQWVGMGEALLRLPIFEAAIKKCDSILKPKGYDIFKIITEKNPKIFDDIINSFLGIAAIQIGLVDVLRSVNLTPDYIIGHSVGELGCSYADGCFTAEEMILAALSRGLASVEVELERGSMAAVGLGYKDVQPLCPPDVDVACHNGPASSTISGPADSMKAFLTSLKAKGIFAREVPCSNIAYHSRYIAPAAPKLLGRLEKVILNPKPRSSKWVSTSVPRTEWNTIKARLSSAEYHTNNLLNPVLFEETSCLIPPNAICVEIAPHGLLQAILKRSLPETCLNIALTRRGHPDNLEILLAALGKLYNVGLQPRISNLYPEIQYPVSRGTASISSLIRWDHQSKNSPSSYVPKFDSRVGEKIFEINLDEEGNEYLQGNVINGKIRIPLSLCLEKVWQISKTFDDESIPDILFKDLQMYNLLTIVPENNIIKLKVTFSRGSSRFEVSESEVLLITGFAISTKAPNNERLDVCKANNTEGKENEITNEDFYTELEMRGYQYAGDFRSVIKSSVKGTNALIKWNDNWVTFIEGALQLYTFGNGLREVQVPLSIRKILITASQHNTAAENAEGIKAVLNKNINYLSAGGLELQGVKLTLIPKTLEQNQLSSDTILITPNIDQTNLALTTSWRIVLQLIIENSFSSKIEKINLIEKNKSQENKKFLAAIYEVPEISLFKIESVSYQDATFNKLLTVIVDDIRNYNITEIAENLKNGKFLLTFISKNQEDSFKKSTESLGLKVVLIRKSENTNIILLKKKRSFKNLHVVNVSKNIKDIINKVKSLKISADDETIILLIKARNKISTAEFLNQLQENVNLEKIRIFDIQDHTVSDNLFDDDFYKTQLELDLLLNILTPKKIWATLRSISISLNFRPVQNWIADKKYLYDPNSITWIEGPVLESSKNIVKVEYSALNPQDILIVNGNFYGDQTDDSERNRWKHNSVGFEFSGTDSKGDRIMGITVGNAMSNLVDVNTELMWTIPKSWSFEDAVTIPFSYAVAYTSLFIKTKINLAHKILVLNPCEGVGLAIINLAMQNKCDIFVTYELENEKKFLQKTFPNLKSNRFFSGDSFQDDILVETNGEHMDIIICNQCEINKLEACLTLVKRNSEVVMISDLNNNDIHESVGMGVFLKQVSLCSVVPKNIIISDNVTRKILVKMLQDGINSNKVKPLPRMTYFRESLNEAFQACMSKNNLGKIIVKVQPKKLDANEVCCIPRLWCSTKKSYLLIEGLTNFGMELIDWLITRGGRHFVVTSSTKNDKHGFRNIRLQLWQRYGIEIILRTQIDLSQQQNIRSLFKETGSLGPIDGIFDLQRIDPSSNNSADLKTKYLDEESRSWCPELRLFVVCKASVNTGSTLLTKKFEYFNSKYNSQDQAVEEILQRRKEVGLHGLIIKLGILESTDQNINTVNTKIILPPMSKYLQKFDEILRSEEYVVEVSYITLLSKEVNEDIYEKCLDDSETQENMKFLDILYNTEGLSEETIIY